MIAIINTMRIYFCGIGGVGIGPLAEIAYDSGYDVVGSDLQSSLMTKQLSQKGITVFIGQEGHDIAKTHKESPIDWFVHTASVNPGHPEYDFAKENDIRISKRDELLSHIITEKGLKLIAVSGTHGKTSTTGILVWLFKQLDIPLSYSVGTTLNFGPSGKYEKDSEYFVYECDEYDRNMLHFNPFITVITALSYDHPDTYKNEHVYKDAFIQFMEQSDLSILWQKDLRYLEVPSNKSLSYEAFDESLDLDDIRLPGQHVRQNAYLAMAAVKHAIPGTGHSELTSHINSFPGVDRRFEKLSENIYSDYGHHPDEIRATLQLAKEISDHVTLVYQPHQNTRQHEIFHKYKDCMLSADKIYWLPTYLSREDKNLPIITPEELIKNLTNKQNAAPAEMGDTLWNNIQADAQSGSLVLVMGAGSIDKWVRDKILAH